MNEYDVTIRATVTKTVRVSATSVDAACEEAHQIFTVASDGEGERYEQDTVDCQKVLP